MRTYPFGSTKEPFAGWHVWPVVLLGRRISADLLPLAPDFPATGRATVTWCDCRGVDRAVAARVADWRRDRERFLAT